jgi:hypothetical protein
LRDAVGIRLKTVDCKNGEGEGDGEGEGEGEGEVQVNSEATEMEIRQCQRRGTSGTGRESEIAGDKGIKAGNQADLLVNL